MVAARKVIDSALLQKTVFGLVKGFLSSDTGKRLTIKNIEWKLKRTPDLCKRGVSRIKNDRTRNALNSNLANTALNYGSTFAAGNLNQHY